MACPQCYTGTCQRHPSQDHGKSKVAKPKNAEETMKKIYDSLVGSQLKKLQAEAAADPSSAHTQAFREQLDASRNTSMRKSKRKDKKTKRYKTGGENSGLNPQALAAINDSDSDAIDDSSSDSSSGEERRHRKKRDRKHRKKKKTKRSESGTDRSGLDAHEAASGSGSSDSSSDEERRHRKKSDRKRRKKEKKRRRHRSPESDSGRDRRKRRHHYRE